jgi:O-antigen/teichoic acid export membrane protein
MFFGVLFGSTLPVFYSHFSNIQNDLARVRSTLIKLVKAIIFLAIPSSLLIFANADVIAALVFGPAWKGIELVIALMALIHGYYWTVGVNGEAYRAVGAPSYETIIMASLLPVYVCAFWLSIQHGLEAFLWTHFGLILATVVVHLAAARRLFKMPVAAIATYLGRLTVLCLPAIAVSHVLIRNSDLGSSVAAVIASVVLVCCAMWWAERNGLIPVLYSAVSKRLQ